jgi:hypothetical protein
MPGHHFPVAVTFKVQQCVNQHCSPVNSLLPLPFMSLALHPLATLASPAAVTVAITCVISAVTEAVACMGC